MKKRIVIVDDHESIRDMLVSILKRESDYEIVGETGTGLQALQICSILQPDVVILDLMLPELSGAEVMRRMHVSTPKIRILVYSGTFNQALIMEALRCKPAGFVDKSDPLESLREAISVVASGGSYFTSGAADYLKASRGAPDAESKLTDREREVLQLVAEGKSSKEISKRLGVASKTVENHRAHLMQKLGVHDVASLTRYAVRHGIVSI